jgi:hypothetical protein
VIVDLSDPPAFEPPVTDTHSPTPTDQAPQLLLLDGSTQTLPVHPPANRAPEPGTLALIGLAIGGMVIMRTKRVRRGMHQGFS